MGGFDTGCFGCFWAAVDKLLVAAFELGVFGQAVTKSRRRSLSVFSTSSVISNSWSSVTSTASGFHSKSAWHQCQRVYAYQQPRRGLRRKVWGFSLLIFASRKHIIFLFLSIILFCEQSRGSAGGIEYGRCIAAGSLSVSSRYFKANV